MKKVLLSLVAIICATSYVIADGDNVGPNIQWWYTDTKQLVRFTGYGPMYDYELSTNQPPWWFVNPYYYELADGITTIGNNAFYGSWLKSFNFPTSLTSIGEYAFISCSFESKNITLPDNLQTIGDLAFASTNITSVYLGSKVKSLGREAFYGCRKLANFTVSSSNPYFTSVDGVLYNKSMTEVIAFPMGDAKGRTSYVVPDGVTKIGHYAFKPGTYYVCQLTSIELPRTLKEIEGNGLSCYEITSITCAAKVPPVATESSFYEMKSSATITVPTGKTAAYKAAPGWSKFTNYVEKDFPDYIDPDCDVPTNIHVDGEAGYSQTKVAWTAGNQNYFGVRYKKSSDSKYIEYPNRIPKAESAVILSPLEPKTSYDVIVYGICGTTIDSDTLSANSAVFTFTTADVPAEQTMPTVENGWVYYGTNTFAGSGELSEGSYWGIKIPTNTAVDKYLDKVSVYAMDNSECEIVIMKGGNTPNNATKAWSQTVVPQTANNVCEFELIDPVEYEKSKNLWVFFRNTGEDYGKTFPVSYMSDVNASNARWLGMAGGSDISWMDLKDIAPDFTYTAWLVNAHFTNTPVYHPYAKDLATSTVSNTGAVIVWKGRGDKYELRYRMEDNPEQEWTVIENIATKSRTITGLKKNVYYEVQVRAKQGEEYSDWSEVLRFYTEKKQAIDNVQTDKQSATKLLKNGQLLIIRDGKTYNATGIRVE
ncbi:MAG: leucine-rich repeat protein [Paludibacteraceae bacterium]|nr:leucine-rich repeat protein [Paludibacteraceae bacterium]